MEDSVKVDDSEKDIYNEETICLKLIEVNKKIEFLEKNKIDVMNDLEKFINDENYYVRKISDAKIIKNLLIPVVTVAGLLSFLSLIVTSKILLIIILGNLVTSSIIVSTAIKYISEVARKEVRKQRNGYYLELYTIEKRLDLFEERKQQLINMYLEEKERKIQNEALISNNIINSKTSNYVRVRKK